MNPADLIRIARGLASGEVGGRRGRPAQADLCRAVSAAYYALFHTLARCCADLLAGSARQNRSQQAWRQIYRALEHGAARDRCKNTGIMSRFAPEVQRFGDLFVKMQELRHAADYDPSARLSRNQVRLIIDETERTISQFNAAGRGQKRAFAVWVLLRSRNAPEIVL